MLDMRSSATLLFLGTGLLPTLASAQDVTRGPDFAIERDEQVQQEQPYSPFVNRSFPHQVFWGDTHLHSSYSWDAGLVGNTLDPGMAYRFAKGEQITASSGQPVKLVRPLDWLVVADHAESLGASSLIASADPVILESDLGRRVYELYQEGDLHGAFETWGLEAVVGGVDPLADPALARRMWDEVVDFAEDHNDPGRFTAFIGYEWSSAPGGNNLHRVVVARDGGAAGRLLLPFSSYDSSDPERLWDWMENYESITGGRVLAIPHNGNLSNGVMFQLERLGGGAIDRDYAERRARFEPLYEVTQMKGDGEAHPLLSPDDDFADYEEWDRGNWNGERKTPDMLPQEYARSALKLGLQAEAELGVNPFKFGLVGGTDSHTSLATTREDNYWGKSSVMEPSADRWDGQIVPDPAGAGTGTWEFETIASGLQGVWARENTREALWDAMAQKETYATTGSRITVRVFAGWDFNADDVLRPDFAEVGYTRGVPMGGELTSAPSGGVPRMMVRALRDPDGANLDRVQIVKGWYDSSGQLQERVYDVACSDARQLSGGSCSGPVGSSVDVQNATFTNDIGEALLMAHWEDPDFDENESAFYYVRVLEIPTPRWTTHDAAFYGLDLPDGVPAIQQDRAYTSPIWYTPRD